MIEIFEKTFNNVISGDYTSLYGSCVSEKNTDNYVTNISLLSDYILSYFDLMGANQSEIKGIRKINREQVAGILERLYNYSTYNCTNTPLFSAMLEVALEINDKVAINKLERVCKAYDKLAIVEPKTIGMLRVYYDKEF